MHHCHPKYLPVYFNPDYALQMPEKKQFTLNKKHFERNFIAAWPGATVFLPYKGGLLRLCLYPRKLSLEAGVFQLCFHFFQGKHKCLAASVSMGIVVIHVVK